MTRPAISCRLSQDRAGTGLAVTRQEQACQALCVQRGWVVAKIYADDDIGMHTSKSRPAWQQLISDVASSSPTRALPWQSGASFSFLRDPPLVDNGPMVPSRAFTTPVYPRRP